jgi:hypothetical protein
MTAIIHKKNTIEKDKFKGKDNNLAEMSIDKKTTDFIMAVCAE